MNTGTPIIDMQETAGNAPVTLDPLQQFLAPHVDVLITCWIIVWAITALVMLYKLWSEYRAQKPQK